mmetsp:Transcript_31679/g.73468  ORF Transcript_31679/g.73468 Transcript_31679/m.73468 type:complete len:209 (-) Transcript_31679:751-1377(-)
MLSTFISTIGKILLLSLSISLVYCVVPGVAAAEVVLAPRGLVRCQSPPQELVAIPRAWASPSRCNSASTASSACTPLPGPGSLVLHAPSKLTRRHHSRRRGSRRCQPAAQSVGAGLRQRAPFGGQCSHAPHRCRPGRRPRPRLLHWNSGCWCPPLRRQPLQQPQSHPKRVHLWCPLQRPGEPHAGLDPMPHGGQVPRGAVMAQTGPLG